MTWASSRMRLFEIRIVLPPIYTLLFFILPSSSSRALVSPLIRSGKRVLMSFPWRIPASLAKALNSIPLRGERSAKWYECSTLNADGRIWTHRPCSPWHISFQDCALITVWVRRHNGNAFCKVCLFLESTHRLYHPHNADSRTWTYAPSFDGYWRFSKPFPYQLGLYLQNRRQRDQQAAADNSYNPPFTSLVLNPSAITISPNKHFPRIL